MSKVLIVALLVSLLKSTNLYSDTCLLQHDLMFAVASTEANNNRDIGYPYLISFNDFKNKSKMLKIQKTLKGMVYEKIDKRTIDCIEQENCTKILDRLLLNNIQNVDLGAFQICYKWHKLPKKDYFSLTSSYKKACSLIQEKILKHGNTWKSIAMYHSSTPKINAKYIKKLQKNIIKYYPKYLD